jgi:hypothetical protein
MAAMERVFLGVKVARTHRFLDSMPAFSAYEVQILYHSARRHQTLHRRKA